MNKAAFLLGLALSPSVAISAPSTVYSREQIKPLVLQVEALNDRCRGGSGDDPETQKICDQRDLLGQSIADKGWCWGDGSDTQIGADKQWQLCKPQQGQPPELWPVPRFNVEATCKAISAAGGSPSEMILQGCFRQEQASYNQVKSIWMKIPQTMQTTCTNIAKSSGSGSYMILNGCIKQEMQSQQSNENFKFNY